MAIEYYLFVLRFGLANVIDNYLLWEIGIVCAGNFIFLLIECIIPNRSKIYFWVPEIFKTNVSNRFLSENLCSGVAYFVVKKLVWKVRINAF